MMTRDAVLSICAEFDIKVVPKHRYPMPGETRALATIERIWARHGEGHLRLVLTTIGETKGNQGLLDEVSLWAVSDLVNACPQWVEDRTSEWLAAWDRLPMGPFTCVIQDLRGVVSQREALAGLAYYWLRSELDPEVGLTDRMAGRAVQIRANNSEAEKGRPTPSRRQQREAERLVLGLELIAAKRRLPHGQFGRWLAEQNIPRHTAHKCMNLARAAGGHEADEVA